MAGIDSLLFVKVLCDFERKKIDTSPDKVFTEEAPTQEEQLSREEKSPCFVKIYMQEKYGTGGSMGSKRYACRSCSCLFRHKRHLRQHVQSHCTHKCLGCSECYANIFRSFKQIGGETPQLLKTFSCLSCPSSFLTQAGLAIHEECHPQNDEVVECESYSEQFDNHSEIDKHQKTKLTSGRYKCEHCDKVYATSSNLWRHKSTKHMKDNQHIGIHFLDQFDKDCHNENQHSDGHHEEDELDKHQKTKLTSGRYKCEHCDKVYATSSNLWRHKSTKHMKNNQRIGIHFLDQFDKDCHNENQHSDGHHEEDESGGVELQEASSRVCALCYQSFKYCLQNRSHVCSKFPSLESLKEEMFDHGSFQCPACSQIYTSFVALKMHCGAHTGCDPLTCFHCDKKFSSLSKADHHFEFHGRNTCKKCGVFFYSKVAVLLHHCGYTQRCFVCDQVFPSRRSYLRHLHVHPLPKTFVYKCTQCQKSFLKEPYFRAHQIEHTGTPPFPCSLCDQKFFMYGPFKKHVLIHIDNDRLKCKICDLRFKSAKELEEHRASHKSVIETESAALQAKDVQGPSAGFQCQECNRAFRQQYKLFVHLRDAHGKAPSYTFTCQFCSRGFYYKPHRNAHMACCSQRSDEERKQVSEKMERKELKKARKKQFECPKCEKKYFTQHFLDNHMYVHRDLSECPYRCDLCGVGYARKYNLTLHLIKCRGADPEKATSSFKCKECGAMFISEKTLKRHTKAHQNEWECSLCKRKFITKRGYEVHKTSCTPETIDKPIKPPKIYTCPSCMRNFKLKHSFEAHVASHEGIMPYQCPTCFQKFMSSNNFKRHKCKFATKSETTEPEKKLAVP